jgi:hypothetical protein
MMGKRMVEAVKDTAQGLHEFVPAFAMATGAALMIAAGVRLVRKATRPATARLGVALALFAVALRLIAAAVGEFQTLGVLQAATADVPAWLAALAGNPTREAMAIQAAFVIVAYALLAQRLKKT